MARRKTIQHDPLGRLQSEYEEEEEEYGDALLKDGQTLRVPLYLKDGTINPRLTPTQRGKAEYNQQLADAQARKFGLQDALQLHRPGFRRNTDSAALERSQQAYAAYDAADAAAYKQTRDYSEHTGGDPARTGAGAPAKGSGAPAGAYPYSAAAEGTSCTINGAPGVLVRQGNSLVCQPRRSQDAAAFDAKQAAYDEYDRIASNAWRSR